MQLNQKTLIELIKLPRQMTLVLQRVLRQLQGHLQSSALSLTQAAWLGVGLDSWDAPWCCLAPKITG